MPQTLVVSFADGSRETVRWENDAGAGAATSGPRWQRYQWLKPVKAVSAQLDPDGLNHLDASTLDNGRTLKPDRRASCRLATDLGGLLQAAFALVGTL